LQRRYQKKQNNFVLNKMIETKLYQNWQYKLFFEVARNVPLQSPREEKYFSSDLA